MTVPDASGMPWLSPTSGARLIRCPASIQSLPQGARPATATGPPRNAGSAAHLALQRWVDSGTWRTGSEPGGLPCHYDEILDEFGLDVASLKEGRTTRARLRLRERELAELLHQQAPNPNDAVASEVTLYDDRTRLWGTLDLLIAADALAVVDLKTGADAAAAEVNDEIRRQVLLYAALAHSHFSRWPGCVAVFSLRSGRIDVAWTSAEAAELAEEATSARATWAAGVRPARPAPDVCLFCSRRLACDPHWEAAATWDSASGVEGVVESVAVADTGRAAALLVTERGKAWLTHLDDAAVGSDAVGRRLRATFVKPSQVDDEGRIQSWRATENTAVAVEAATAAGAPV